MADEGEENSRTLGNSNDMDRNQTRSMMGSSPHYGFNPMHASMAPPAMSMGMNMNMAMGGMMDPSMFPMPMMNQQQWQTGQQKKRPSENQPVPSNYVCKKCGEPGHWIYYCPNTPKGQFVQRVPNVQNTQYQPRQYAALNERGKVRFPDEMTCMICNGLIREATLVSCCGKSFCKECIENHSGADACPHCHTRQTQSRSLIPNRSLREIITEYNENQESAKDTANQQGASNDLPAVHNGNETKEAGPSTTIALKQSSSSQGGQPIQSFDAEGRVKPRNKTMNTSMPPSMMPGFMPGMMMPGMPFPMSFGPDMGMMPPDMMPPGMMPPDMWFNGGGPPYPNMPFQADPSGHGAWPHHQQMPRYRENSADGNIPADETLSGEDIPTGPRAERESSSPTTRYNRRRYSRSPSHSRSPSRRDRSQKRSASRSTSRSRAKSVRADDRAGRQSSSSRSRRDTRERSPSKHRSDDRYRSDDRDRDRDRYRRRDRSRDNRRGSRDRRERSRDRGSTRDKSREERERSRGRGRERSRDDTRHSSRR